MHLSTSTPIQRGTTLRRDGKTGTVQRRINDRWAVVQWNDPDHFSPTGDGTHIARTYLPACVVVR